MLRLLSATNLYRLVLALGGLLILVGGVFTFGVFYLFEPLYVTALLLAAYWLRQDKNILSMLAILLLYWLLYAIAWQTLFIWTFTDHHIVTRALIYLFSLLIALSLRYCALGKLTLASSLLLIGIEVIWYEQAYPAPYVYWFQYTLTLTLLTQHLVFYRFPIVERLFKATPREISMDWHITHILYVEAALSGLMIMEYLIRHLTSLKPMLVYDFYSYANHAVSCFILWVILRTFLNRQLERTLNA